MTAADTIVAISSSTLRGARIIVRISGPEAHAIAGQLIDQALPAASSAARMRLHFAGMTAPAWIYVFAAPRSYTGEDLLEFHLPGNPLLAGMLLDRLFELGARQADPGEFTARAYFNGKLDLAEAEGVAATIAATSGLELAAARQLVAGELARRLKPIMDDLAQMLALVEAGIDFSDEDVTFLAASQIEANVRQIDEALGNLVDTSARFERLSHEPRFVLVGRPNAGKSTLLNALAESERAIVSPTRAGTTRDALSAQVRLPRGWVQVTDVAGLETEAAGKHVSAAGEIPAQMQSHALRELEEADHVLLVHDITDERALLDLPRAPALVILSKSDLARAESGTQSAGMIVSAASGDGMDVLKARLDQIAFGAASSSATLALNARHLAAINGARLALGRARADAAAELVAMDLREALDALGLILGRLSPDDLLGRVFSTFCIGK